MAVANDGDVDLSPAYVPLYADSNDGAVDVGDRVVVHIARDSYLEFGCGTGRGQLASHGRGDLVRGCVVRVSRRKTALTNRGELPHGFGSGGHGRHRSLEGVLEVAPEVIDVFEADRHPEQPG
jgi:hypothetical protein